MLLQFTPEDDALYSKLYVSRSDLAYAQQCTNYLLKNGMHNKPWERRGLVYFRQSAFTTALIVSYARPFTRSDGWPKLPADLASFTQEEQALHDKMLQLRHKVYAHSDSDQFSIRPWSAEGLETDIVGAPFHLIEKEDVTVLVPLIERLSVSISKRMNAMRTAASAASTQEKS